jgi:N-acetylglucosamine-6-phosphate deacetylase
MDPGQPTYFDLQVNGYAGVDFNADGITSESIRQACAAMRADGVDRALATVITADLEVMARRLSRIVATRHADPIVAEVIAGIHVEGPFISAEAGYVGAHPAAAARPASLDAAKQLLDAGDGLARLMTLAPERDPAGEVTGWLIDQGVRVSAGHCNPTLDQLRSAIDAGLSLFTHLGNGCPLVMHRHDNVIQRVLSVADRLWITFIADGVHVPFHALKNYLSMVGVSRAIVVSDATAAAGMGPGVYELAGQKVVVDEKLTTWSEDRSHLVGSACTMKQMEANLCRELGMSSADVARLFSDNPRRAIGERQR